MKEEITKEIKNISEIETTPTEEVEEVKTTQPVEEPPKETKPSKKKIWIIGGIVAGVLLLIILIIVLIPKNKEDSAAKTKKNKESKFVTAVKESLKSGEFDKEIQEGLQESNIETDSVCILRMDLDSDGDQGLVAYAEGNNKKALIQLEVDDRVSYEDNFPLNTKDSIGLAYSSETEENHWYTEYEKNYTIISSAKKIIKEEDFLSIYFSLTKTYQQKPILNHCIEYKFDKDLDAKELEENTITEKDILEDNNIKKEEIKEAYKKYLTEKAEKEQKEKEELEKQKKAEEMQKKLSGFLIIGQNSYKYGNYKLYNVENAADGEMVLYSDRTCIYKEKECTYEVGEVRNAEDELVPGITLNNGKTFVSTEEENVLSEPNEKITAKYE